MSIWLSKRFHGGEYSVDQDIVAKLLVQMPYMILMVSERVPGTAEQIVHIWLKNPDLARLFPGFERSEKPTNPRPGLLAGEIGVFEDFFPKQS